LYSGRSLVSGAVGLPPCFDALLELQCVEVATLRVVTEFTDDAGHGLAQVGGFVDLLAIALEQECKRDTDEDRRELGQRANRARAPNHGVEALDHGVNPRR